MELNLFVFLFVVIELQLSFTLLWTEGRFCNNTFRGILHETISRAYIMNRDIFTNKCDECIVTLCS